MRIMNNHRRQDNHPSTLHSAGSPASWAILLGLVLPACSARGAGGEPVGTPGIFVRPEQAVYGEATPGGALVLQSNQYTINNVNGANYYFDLESDLSTVIGSVTNGTATAGGSTSFSLVSAGNTPSNQPAGVVQGHVGVRNAVGGELTARIPVVINFQQGAPNLVLDPPSGTQATGTPGSFQLVQNNYSLINNGSATGGFKILTTEPWLHCQAPERELIQVGESLTLPIRIVDNAVPFSPGTYTGSVEVQDRINSSTIVSIPVSLTVSGAAVVGGWTNLNPSVDSLKIYVSSAGNDSSSGLSESQAKKTLAAGYSLLRDGKPDWLYLRRGDTWSERFSDWKKSGRSSSEPMVVSSYGSSSARPRLHTGVSEAINIIRGLVADVAFVGLYMTPHNYNGSNGSPRGVQILNQGRRILFEDCMVQGYKDNFVIQGSSSAPNEDIKIRRCVIVDAYSASSSHAQGIFASNCDRLLVEECVLDHNGYRENVAGANQTVFNHNLYFQYNNRNIAAKGNIIARGSSHGGQFRSGGEVLDNLFLENAINLLMGTSSSSQPNGVPADVVGNVFLGGRNTDGLPRGTGIHFQNISSGVAEYNIVAHNVLGSGPSAVVLDGKIVGVNNFTYQNNVIFNWRRMSLNTTQFAGVKIRNNHFQDQGNNTLIENNRGNSGTGIAWSNNQYYSARTTSSWFIDGAPMDFGSWAARVSAAGSAANLVNYPNPHETIQHYDLSNPYPGAGTLDSFMAEARAQSKSNWRLKFVGTEAVKYFRANFGVVVN